MHDNGQLRAVHLILGYKLISSGFHALKCVIKSKDLCLQHISVVAPGFLLPKGAPIPEGTLLTQPISRDDLVSQSISEGILRAFFFWFLHTTSASASSQPTNKEEKEREEEEEKEIMDVSESDSEDLYEVFNQPPSLETFVGDLGRISQPPPNQTEGAVTLSDEMGIHRKQRLTLQKLLESQPSGFLPQATLR